MDVRASCMDFVALLQSCVALIPVKTLRTPLLGRGLERKRLLLPLAFKIPVDVQPSRLLKEFFICRQILLPHSHSLS